MSKTFSFRLEDDEAAAIEAEAEAQDITLSSHLIALVRFARDTQREVLSLEKAITTLDRLSAAINRISALPQPAQEEQLVSNLELLEHMRLVIAGGAPDKVEGIQKLAKDKARALIEGSTDYAVRQAKEIADEAADNLADMQIHIVIPGGKKKKPQPDTPGDMTGDLVAGLIPDGEV